MTSAETKDLRALKGWLDGERELAGRVRVLRAAIGPGHMGGLSDTITVAVGGGGVGAVLVQSIFAWLRQRQRGHRVRLTLQDGGNRRIELELDGVQASDPIVERVLGFFSDDS